MGVTEKCMGGEAGDRQRQTEGLGGEDEGYGEDQKLVERESWKNRESKE